MTRHTPANCRNEECDFCMRLADGLDDDPGYASDWQVGQDSYERDMDRLGGSL